MTKQERDELIDNYAWECVDNMDTKTMCRALAEQIAASMETYTLDEVIEQVNEHYPHLLDND